MKSTEEGVKLTYKYWVHWFNRFNVHPELSDIRIKVMLTLITVNPYVVTHVELQRLFKLTDKTVRNMRTVLRTKGWTEETFVDRHVTIRPTQKAVDLLEDLLDS